jgi:hypothetical protein
MFGKENFSQKLLKILNKTESTIEELNKEWREYWLARQFGLSPTDNIIWNGKEDDRVTR